MISTEPRSLPIGETLTYSRYAIIPGVILLATLGLTSCSGETESQPTQKATVQITVPPTSSPSASASAGVNSGATTPKDADKVFAGLPDAKSWELTNGGDGEAAIRKTADRDAIKSWVQSYKDAGWELTVTEDTPSSYLGYLTKDRLTLTFLSGTDPKTKQPIEAIFYYMNGDD